MEYRMHICWKKTTGREREEKKEYILLAFFFFIAHIVQHCAGATLLLPQNLLN